MLLEIETSRFRRITKWHIRRVLKWINEEDLKDLHAIRVLDDDDDPEVLRPDKYLNDRLKNGHYEFKAKDRDPRVVLFANNIYLGLPHFMMYTPAATLKLAGTLAHEIGHHVVATKGYIHKPWEKYRQWNGVTDPYEEKMVEDYAQEVLARMLRRWPYKFGLFLTQKFAALVYQASLEKYRREDYVKAARLGFRAYGLDKTRLDANQVYRHAMEKLKTETPSPLNEVDRDWLLNKYDGNRDETLRKWRLDQVIEKGQRKKKRQSRSA